MIPKIYIDTSVIGGHLDNEFSTWTKTLFDGFCSGRKKAVVSDLTLRELEEAPEEVRHSLADLPSEAIEYVFLFR